VTITRCDLAWFTVEEPRACEGTCVAPFDGEEHSMKHYVWLALLVGGCHQLDHNVVARTDIVTDATDPSLINAWGLAFNPMGVAWISANGTGISEVYDIHGNHVIPAITIPTPATPAASGMPATPTGQVFNGDSTAFMGDAFIFATEDGTISGWQASAGSAARLRIDNSGSSAVYKGVAIGTANNGDARLYAANFHNNSVDVYDTTYRLVPSGFVDPLLPAGFAPFNVAIIQGDVLVSYALQDADKGDDVAGNGNGFVDVYDGDGNLLDRLLSGGQLNSPWGMVLAPSSFDAAPNQLLVGNFGDGLIHFYELSFDSDEHAALLGGILLDETGSAITIDGLWALQFGPGSGGFASSSLYFTAGPDMEMHGGFGALTSTE
jgi:uncharacterized protein (TIGR03118 family)